MSDRKRWTARLLFLAITALLLIDTFPAELPRQPRPYGRFTQLLQAIGLLQGEWTMFAPNPSARNVAFSAEIALSDGTVVNWDSPSWADYGRWDRFCKAREVNYFDRVGSPGNGAALDDLASYLARRTEGSLPAATGLGRFGPPEAAGLSSDAGADAAAGSGPAADALSLPAHRGDPVHAAQSPRVVSVKLYRQMMRILPPDVGQFPTAQNMRWSASSELVREWTVEP